MSIQRNVIITTWNAQGTNNKRISINLGQILWSRIKTEIRKIYDVK